MVPCNSVLLSPCGDYTVILTQVLFFLHTFLTVSNTGQQKRMLVLKSGNNFLVGSVKVSVTRGIVIVSVTKREMVFMQFITFKTY